MKQNILKVRTDKLILDGFEKINEKMIVSLLHNSIVFYPYTGKGLKSGQLLCELDQEKKTTDILFIELIKNHLNLSLDDNVDLIFLYSPIYELNLDSYIYLPSKQQINPGK